MKKINLLLLLFIATQIFSAKTFAQSKAGNTWYFGNYAGLTFNTGPGGATGDPTYITNGKLNTNEGCTAYSDKNGNLLFYSDGVHLYDANPTHPPIATDLKGNSSSTQSALAIQCPGNDTLFYLFVMDAGSGVASGNGYGFTYNILHNVTTAGLILKPTEKNLQLYGGNGSLTPCDEKLTATSDGQGGYWIVIKELKTSGTPPNYVFFRLQSNGLLNKVPDHKTPAQAYADASGPADYGQMKFSSDGSKFAAVNFTAAPNIELYNFNRSTGQLSTTISLNVPNAHGGYGTEFSPDGTKLYVSTFLYSGSDELYQFDLNAGAHTQANIQNSITKIKTLASTEVGGQLQLGPNGRIYFAFTGNYSGNNAISAPNYIGVITKPNLPGTNCLYQENVMLNASTKGFYDPTTNPQLSFSGLPVFLSSIFQDTCAKPLAGFSADSSSCQGDKICTTSIDTSPSTVHQWNFGDNPSIYSNAANPCYTYSKPGTYTITHIVSNSCGRDTVKHTINIHTKKDGAIKVLGQSPFCQGDSVRLTVANHQPGDSIVWQPVNVSKDTLTVKNSGTYLAIIYSKNGCIHTCLAVRVDMLTSPSATLRDTTICNGGTATLNAGSGYAMYKWNTGANTQTIAVTSTGNYCVTVTGSAGCTASACATVKSGAAIVNLSDTIICAGTTVTLSAGSGYSSYHWSNSSNASSISVSDPGTYTVTVTNAMGCTGSGSSKVTIRPKPSAAFLINDSICSGVKVCALAQDTAKDVKHVWNFGDDPLAFSVGNLVCHKYSGPGTYTVIDIASNACGSDTVKHTITVSSDHDASIEVIGKNPFCQGDFVKLTVHGSQPGDHIVWDPVNVTTDTLVVRNSGTFSAIVYNKNGCIDSCLAVTVTMNRAPMVSLRDTIICNGGTATLDAGAGNNYQYNWSNGAATEKTTTKTAGIYVVTITNGYGCTAIGHETVTIDNAPVEVSASESTYCPGDIIQLSAGAPCVDCSYQWYYSTTRTFGPPTTPQPLLNGNQSNVAAQAPPSNLIKSITYIMHFTDARGCSGSSQVTVTRNTRLGACSIIGSNPGAFMMTPNPVNANNGVNSTVMFYALPNVQSAIMEVYTAYGQKAASYALDPAVNQQVISIDGLPAGIYFVYTVADGQKINTQRLVVVR